jgi:photosynthetic reaction center cytochrome c subunit
MRRLLLLTLASSPCLYVLAQQGEKPPTCEQVYKNIEVFKGLPASELIPAMEFMAASLKWECTDCHDPKDYAAENETKATARKMVLMQREINAKHFNGRQEVTCFSCHGGKEHPAGMPIPEGLNLRHERMTNPPKAEDLFAKHLKAIGTSDYAIVRTGTLTAPNDQTHKVESLPVVFITAPGGRFSLVAGERKVVSDGKQVWYGAYPMTDEPAAIFNRVGKVWHESNAFAGLERASVSGTESIGKATATVVRAANPGSSSTQELYFDNKSGLILRLMNARRSNLGTVLSVTDYANYKKVGTVQVPMKVVTTYAGGEQWIMEFKAAKIDPTIKDSTFAGGQ